MDAYVYQGDLLCGDCGELLRAELTRKGKAPENPDDEESYDSGDFPKGPYPDGGGEADVPQHCGMAAACVNALTCTNSVTRWKVGCFLENPLTNEGAKYVCDTCEDFWYRGEGTREVIELWAKFYDVEKPKSVDPDAGELIKDEAVKEFYIDTAFEGEPPRWYVKVGSKIYSVVDKSGGGIDFEEL